MPSEDHASPHTIASMKHMAHEALHDLLHFDAKLFKSLPALLLKPGLLTEKTLKGEPGYMKPFTLFVFLNFLFFLIKNKGLFHYTLDSYTNDDFFNAQIASRLASLHLSPEILAERFNTAMHFEQKEYLVVMVPLFALLLQLLYLFKKRSYAMHLIFALNFYSWFILWMVLLPVPFFLLAWSLKLLHLHPAFLNSENSLALIMIGSCFAYLLPALRRVYADRWWLASMKALALGISVVLLIVVVYKPVLFFIVMHSISD